MEVTHLSLTHHSHSAVCMYLHLCSPRAAVWNVSVFLIAFQTCPALTDPDDLSFLVICVCMSYSCQQDFLRSSSSDFMRGVFQSVTGKLPVYLLWVLRSMCNCISNNLAPKQMSIYFSQLPLIITILNLVVYKMDGLLMQFTKIVH